MKKTKNKLKIMGLLLTLVISVSLLGVFSLAASAAESYNVKFINIGHPGTSFNGDSTAVHGIDYTFKIILNPGYALDNLQVVIGDVTVNDPYEGCTYNSSDGTFTIPGEDITGDVTIFAYPIFEKYTVTVDGSNLTIDNAVATAGNMYEGYLLPIEGFAPPDTITVTCGGIELPTDPNVVNGYWYWPNNGMINIPGSLIIDDIVITGSAKEIPSYSVTLNGTGNPTIDVLYDKWGEDYRAIVIPAEDYALPNQINVWLDGEPLGVSYYSWSASHPGEIVISAITLYKNNNDYKDIELTVNCVSGSFDVSFYGIGIEFPSETTATAGTDYTITLQAQNGYTLPDSIMLSIDNIALNSARYTYDQNTGEITVPGEIISGDIGIVAYGDPMTGQSVSVTLNGTTLSVGENTSAIAGEDYTAILTPAPGHTLPESIGIIIEANSLTLGDEFTYDKNTGEITIKGSSIVNNIFIDARGIPNVYSVTLNGTNLSIEGDLSATAGDIYTATLSTDEGYTLPGSVTVTVGGTVLPNEKYYYEKSVNAGTVIIYENDIFGDIVITAEGVVRIYEVILSEDHLSLDGDTSAIGNKDYIARIVSEIGYDVPYDVDLNVGGIYLTWGQYNWDRDTQQLTIYGQYIDGNIAIIAEAVKGYEVHFNGTNVSSDGKGVAIVTIDYTAKLTAHEGYILPQTIVVTVDGTVIESGVGYTYDSVTGELTISGNYLYSDVNIIAEGIHVHQWDSGEITKDPTCSAVGVKTFTCTHNGEHIKTEDVAVDANAHAWDEGVITKQATCTEKGVKTFTCTHNSEHTKTEAVDALGHKYDNDCDGACNVCAEARTPAEHSDANDDRICDECGAELPREGLSGGAIAAIAIGAVAVAGLGGFSLFWFVIKKKKWSDLIGMFKK